MAFEIKLDVGSVRTLTVHPNKKSLTKGREIMKNLIAAIVMALIVAILFWNTISDVEEGVVETTFQSETSNVREPIRPRTVTDNPVTQVNVNKEQKKEEVETPESFKFSVRLRPVIADGPPPEGYEFRSGKK